MSIAAMVLVAVNLAIVVVANLLFRKHGQAAWKAGVLAGYLAALHPDSECAQEAIELLKSEDVYLERQP